MAAAAGGLLRPAFAQITSAQSTTTQTTSDAERLVKAAYLYHFCTLVTWPPSRFAASDTPLRVGILGDEELADELQKVIASRSRAGRPIEVLKLRRPRPDLQVLFISESQRANMNALLAPYRAQPVLTVTESEHGLERGSIINFVPIHGNLRFEVSQQAAEESKLEISSRLLSVAWNFAPASPKFR